MDRRLRLAKAYTELGELEEAARVLTEPPAQPPGSKILLPLIQIYLKLGDFHGAAEAAKKLVPFRQTLPNETRQALARTLLLAGEGTAATPLLPPKTPDAEWTALRGLAELVQNRPELAVESFQAANVLAKQDAWNLYMEGYARAQAGQKQEAISVWRRALALPEPPPALIYTLCQARPEGMQGAVARSANTSDPGYWRATAALEQTRQSDVAAQLARGYALFHDGDPWQAEKLWEEALPGARGADREELYAALHGSTFKRQDAPGALRWATAALQFDPQNPYFHKRRAEALLGQNLLQEAKAEAQKIGTLDRAAVKNPSAWRECEPAALADLLCRIALDGGQPGELQTEAKRLRELRPESPDSSTYLGEWQGQQGRDEANLEKTLKLYTDASMLAPKDADIAAQRGILLQELKRPLEAQPELLRALTLWPSVMEGAPHAQLAQLCQAQGKTAEAAFHVARYDALRHRKERWPVLLKALREPEKFTEAEWLELGELAARRRENWIALCAFRQAARISPENPAAYRGMASMYKRDGFFAPALEAVLQSRRLDEKRRVKT